jgi:adenylate cyclase
MKKRLLYGILIGTASALVSLFAWTMGYLDLWEYATWKWRVGCFARPAASTKRIKLILLDQSSLDWGEKVNGWSWPWPREVYAPLIDFCSRTGARAVIFDVLFTEPSLYGVEDDRALGSVVGRGPAVVVPLHLGKKAGETGRWPSDIPLRRILRLENMEDWAARASREVHMQSAAFPVPEVTREAFILAGVADDPDVDGVFRRSSLFRIFDGRAVPSLGLAAFMAGGEFLQGSEVRTGGREEAVESPAFCVGRVERGRLSIGGRTIPIDESARAILRFRGPPGAYETCSAAAVIQSELRLRAGEDPVIEDIDIFRDCYVFFGFSAPGLLDLRPTPLSRVSPGVEVHAAVLDNLLAGDFIKDVPPGAVVLSTLLVSILTACMILWSRKARHTLVVFVPAMSVPLVIGMVAYEAGFWWPVVAQAGSTALSVFGAVVTNYAVEGRQKAFIKKAFKYYLSPTVIERILDDPSQLKLGGERRELTILFSDLQGFSAISERLDPQALTSLLNEYLTDMTEIILDEGGTLDKYEGDAIIAFWNAPLAQPDHAVRACRAAGRCQKRLEERRQEFREKAGVMLYARIGLNTGEVVVGNMGSRNRFDYTVLGDAANLASRLEGANKAFGTFTMISESTWVQTSGRFRGREIGLVRVVGRKTPVRVFELPAMPDGSFCCDFDEFHRALKFCYERRWAEALPVFLEYPDDPVSRVYARRCRTLVEDPSAEWDGVWNLTEK